MKYEEISNKINECKNKSLDELKDKLERCRKISLEDIQPEDVDEITDIKIDKRKSSNERILDFLNKVKNPYIFKVNGRLEMVIYLDKKVFALLYLKKV